MFGDAKLRNRLTELEESFRRIEHAFKQLQVEWTETYDKFRQLHWRVAKRAQQLENAEAESAVEVPTTPPGENLNGDSATSFSPKQLEAQRAVLARRNRNRSAARSGG